MIIETMSRQMSLRVKLALLPAKCMDLEIFANIVYCLGGNAFPRVKSPHLSTHEGVSRNDKKSFY